MAIPSRDISEILQKINEMRAVFVLGQRAVPFLEEIFFFLKEISPLIDEINASILESTATMPRATSQLLSVSEATELATTEIMDLVDAVLERLAPLRDRASESAANLTAIESSAEAMAVEIEASFRAAGLDVPAAVGEAIASHAEALADARSATAADAKAIEDIRDRVNRIMISLQVQDITAQQIASVNHLIESIRDRMMALVERLGTNHPVVSDEIWPVYTDTNFDPHARYDASDHRQSLVDSVMAGAPAEPPEEEAPPAAKTPSAGPASQAEIDALFQNGFA